MKFRPIIVDSTLQELTEHGTAEFPVSMDRQIVLNEQCALVKHWHHEIQIVLVTEGSVLFRTPAGEFLLQQGHGLFINSGCMHEAVPTDDKNSVYICINFHPRLLYGYSGSLIRRDYVDPVLFSTKMQAIPLYAEPWHEQVCKLLRELAQVNSIQQYGYEISMTILLKRIWILLLENNRQSIELGASISFVDKQRMNTLRIFIHKHYMDKISLSEIAGAAHISKGECCRIFKRVESTTPFLYLIRYRIAQSCKLLATTDLSVASIAYQVGFGSSSYFTECFKKEIGCTPLEYRKRNAPQ